MLLSKVNYATATANTASATPVVPNSASFLASDDYRSNGYLMHHHQANGQTNATFNAYSAAAAAAAALSASTQSHHHPHLNSSTHSIEVILGAQRILQSEFEKTFQQNTENYKKFASNNSTSDTPSTNGNEILKSSKQLNSSYDAGKFNIIFICFDLRINPFLKIQMMIKHQSLIQMK